MKSKHKAWALIGSDNNLLQVTLKQPTEKWLTTASLLYTGGKDSKTNSVWVVECEVIF